MGALVIAIVIGASPTGFYWTPLSIGLVYHAGAGVGATVLADARAYAVANAAVGVVNLVLAALPDGGLRAADGEPAR